MASALIGLGGNLGDVRATFDRAIPMICERARSRLIARSSDYGTPPWGDEAQPDFINACIAIETALAPLALLDVLHAVEAAFGRDRANERRWGPRPLDLDLLAYDDVTLESDRLTLPHPRARERAFVLVPLAEIAPERRIGDETIANLSRTADRSGIRKLPPRA